MYVNKNIRNDDRTAEASRILKHQETVTQMSLKLDGLY